MTIGINTILKTAEKVKFKAVTNLDNTLTQPHALDDACSGLVPLSGHDSTIDYKSNSAVTISSDSIPGEQTTVMMTGGVSLGASIPEPYTTGRASRTIGNATIVNTLNKHNLKHRRFKGTPVNVSIGGLLNKGKPNENNMAGADYEPYISGKFGNGSVSPDELDIGILPDSSELSPVFPTSTYQAGDSKGQARPYVFGRSFGQVPKPQGEGIHEWHHGGDIDLSGSVFAGVPYVHFGDGYSFYEGDYDIVAISDGPPSYSFTFDNYVKSDFDWIDNSTGVESTSAVNVSVSSTSSRVSITANADNTFTISKIPNPDYTAADFNWKLLSSTVAKTETEISATATVDGALEVTKVGGKWFKIADTSGISTGGTCSIDFTSLEGVNLVLIVRQQDMDGITNWSVTPDSIVAESNSNENYIVTFIDFTGSVIEFDFATSNAADRVAVWVRSIGPYELTPVTIDIDFENQMHSLAIDHTPSNSSFTFDSFNLPRDATLEASTGADFAFERNFNKLSINATIGYGSCTVCFVDLNERNDSLYDYIGGLVDGNFIISPSPLVGNFEISGVRLSEFPVVSGYEYSVEIEARLAKTTIREASIFILLNPDTPEDVLYTTETVTAEWQTFKYIVRSDLDTGATVALSVDALRGTTNFPIKNGGVVTAVSFTNPDEDHSVELKIRVKPRNHTSEINIRSVKGSAEDKLLSFYVDDIARVSADLPPGIALYNNKGRFLASKEYQSLFGDFIGPDIDTTDMQSFRLMSELSAGQDYITSSIAGRRAAYVVDQQDSWFNHVANISAGLDYVAYESAGADGIQLLDRFKFDQYPADLIIKQDDVLADSVRSIRQSARQYRYLFSYRENGTDSALTKTYKSKIGYTGDVGERAISSVLYNESDVIAQADQTIIRDSAYSDLIELTLVRQGHDFQIGDVLKIEHDDIPPRTFCEVLDKNNNQNGQTDIKVKAYRYN